jgi:hypothetical protein
MKIEERFVEFEISLINEPLIDFVVVNEVEPLSALDQARRRWGAARLVEEGSQTNGRGLN